MSGFRGFPPELFTFFEGLEKDNSKSFWSAHTTEWEQHVRDPVRPLLDNLAAGSAHYACSVPTGGSTRLAVR